MAPRNPCTIRFTRTMLGIAGVGLLALIAATPAQQTQPAPAKKPADTSSIDAFYKAMHDLNAEAARCIVEHKLPRTAPDFATDFARTNPGATIPPAMFGQAILRVQDNDPIADAYIRWQLTGFLDAKLPVMRDNAFDANLKKLPKMVENPRADRDLLDALAAAAKAGTLNPAIEEKLNAQLNDLAARASAATTLNVAATSLRDWFIAQYAENTSRRLAVSLEKCVALVDAGWPSDDAKASFAKMLEAAAGDRSFSPKDHKALEERLRLVLGRKRLMLQSATIREHTLAVEYADTGIFDFEIRAWSRILQSE